MAKDGRYQITVVDSITQQNMCVCVCVAGNGLKLKMHARWLRAPCTMCTVHADVKELTKCQTIQKCLDQKAPKYCGNQFVSHISLSLINKHARQCMLSHFRDYVCVFYKPKSFSIGMDIEILAQLGLCWCWLFIEYKICWCCSWFSGCLIYRFQLSTYIRIIFIRGKSIETYAYRHTNTLK